MRSPTHLGRLGEARKFLVEDAQCVGCVCFEPLVLIEKRARQADREHAGCRPRMTGSCPGYVQREFSDEREQRRRAEGWINRV